MKLTMEETSDTAFLTLPADTIVGVVVEDVTPRDVAGTNGRQGWTKLSFKFKITSLPAALEGEYGILVDTPIWGSVGARFTEHPDNKLRQWAEALLDIGELNAGFELDTDMLIGRKARGVVGVYVKRDGSTNHQIAALLPAVPAAALSLVSDAPVDDDIPF